MKNKINSQGEYKIIFVFGVLSPEAHDSIVYEYEELFDLYVSNKDKVIDIKKKIVQKLAERNPPIEITPETMRLRERNALYLGQVYFS